MARSPLNGKQAVQVSGTTVERYKAPPNPKMAALMTQFVVDYKKQKSYMPSAGIVSATQLKTNSVRAINKSGRSASLGPIYNVDLGGSPDDPGKF